MKVYAAFRSYPDYSAPPPSLVSLHETYVGAWLALEPKGEYQFTPAYSSNEWIGPDGYGLIRLMEILP